MARLGMRVSLDARRHPYYSPSSQRCQAVAHSLVLPKSPPMVALERRVSDDEHSGVPALLASRVYGPPTAAWSADVFVFDSCGSVRSVSCPMPPIIVRSASLVGWHPRHVAHLGSPALRSLRLALRVVEWYGWVHADFRRVKVPTISQLEIGPDTTKARAIGHDGSLLRVVTRARRPIRRDWEASAAGATGGIFHAGLGRAMGTSL